MTGEGDQGSVGTRDGVVGGVEEMFWVIGVGMDSGAGIFKINDALEFKVRRGGGRHVGK